MYKMLLSIIFAAVGLFMIVSPESIHYSEIRENVNDSEMSEEYLTTTRTAGKVLLFGSIVGIIVSAIKLHIWLN